MPLEGLGTLYDDGAVVVREGETGTCMFVIQAGHVEVVRTTNSGEVCVATLGPGSTFGEMAIFEREARSATVRALGEARILTIDKRIFLRRVQEDPTLAFNILRELSQRIRRENAELVACRQRLAALEAARPGRDAGDETPGPVAQASPPGSESR